MDRGAWRAISHGISKSCRRLSTGTIQCYQAPNTTLYGLSGFLYNLKECSEMGIPDHLTCLLRNLHAGLEATVRTGHRTSDWFQIWKGIFQGCVLSPCKVNLYAEYIMRNTGLDEPQAGIKIARRNINNLRYADDTTLTAESEEELKSPLMTVKEESDMEKTKWLLVPSLHGK